MSGSIATYAVGKSRQITFRCGRISIWKRRNRPAASVLAALHPMLEHLQRRGAVTVRALGDRLVVAFLDAGLVRRGAVARQGQLHQAAGSFARQLIAVEQHLAEQRLRLVLALLRGK